MSTGHADHQLRPLPIRPRPRTGESIESYIRVLARANHLRPSYLHDYLCHPYQNGRLRIERLAVLSARPIEHLQKALTGIPAPARPRARPHRPATASTQAHAKTRTDERVETFAAIRRDRQREGLSRRTLASRYKVGRRTINQALTSPKPPPRKKLPPRESKALGDATEFIDAILRRDLALPAERQHTIRRIWQRLLDEHATAASYSTVRHYVVLRRKQLTNAAAIQPEPVQAGGITPNQPPPDRLPHEIRSAIRNFAYQLADGTLNPDILAGIDYRPHLIESGPQLEMAFAIFTNVLAADHEGHVTHQDQAQRRAAQWIRAYCSPGYQIEPPLQDWETELI